MFVLNHTYIRLLSAHGSIKGGLVHNNGSRLSVRKGLHNLCLRSKHGYDGIMDEAVISYKPGSDGSRNRLIDSDVGAHVVGGLAGFSRLLPLLLHGGLEAFLVYLKILLLQNLNGQIQRESVSVV